MNGQPQSLLSCLMAGGAAVHIWVFMLPIATALPARQPVAAAGANRAGTVAIAARSNPFSATNQEENYRICVLTDEQMEKIGTLNSQLAQNTAAQKAELRALHCQMQCEINRADVDRAKVLTLQTKINSLRDDLAREVLIYQLDRLSILTAEQRAELRAGRLEGAILGGGWPHAQALGFRHRIWLEHESDAGRGA